MEKFSNATFFHQIALQNLQRKNLWFSETGLLKAVDNWARYTILKLNIQNFTSQFKFCDFWVVSLPVIIAKHGNDFHDMWSVLLRQISNTFNPMLSRSLRTPLSFIAITLGDNSLKCGDFPKIEYETRWNWIFFKIGNQDHLIWD